MTLNMKWWLLAVCLIACALPATAQFFNLSRVGRPSETTFANAGQPWPFGAGINAINYDVGGQGIAYNVPSPSGSCLQSSSYRPDTVNFQVSTAGPPYAIGCSAPGISYNYTINIGGNGPFTIMANLSDTSAGGSWGIYLDNISTGTITTPNTGSFSTFQSALLSAPFNTVPGNHVLQFRALGGDAAFNGSGDFLSFIVTNPSSGGPTPPPGAVAAGFTTLAISLDFQVGQACVAGTCVPTSPFSNWLDCAGASSPQWGAEHAGFCGQITQVTDQGFPVLDLRWILSEYGTYPSTNIGTFQNFQNGFYYETKLRMSNSNPCPPLGPNNPQGCILADAWSYPRSADQSKPFLEWDFIEQYSNVNASGGGVGVRAGGAFANAPTGNFREPGSFGGYDPTVYHYYGWRNTVDGNGNIAECYYYDDTLGTVVPYCSGQGTIGPVPMVGDALITTVGPQTANTNCGPSGNASCNWQVPADLYVQYIHVWACAGWQSGPCNTAILTGPP